MRDQLIPSPVYTSFIHPLLLFVILTSSSSSSSSSPSLLPPFQRANPIPVGRSVGPRFHHATWQPRIIPRHSAHAALARSPDHFSRVTLRRRRCRAEVGIRPSTMSFLIHSYPYPMHRFTQKNALRTRLSRKGLSVLQLGVCLMG